MASQKCTLKNNLKTILSTKTAINVAIGTTLQRLKIDLKKPKDMSGVELPNFKKF